MDWMGFEYTLRTGQEGVLSGVSKSTPVERPR